MEPSSVTLREITGYFNFWREVKQECINENELLKVFATLAERWDDICKCPVTNYSHTNLSVTVCYMFCINEVFGQI